MFVKFHLTTKCGWQSWETTKSTSQGKGVKKILLIKTLQTGTMTLHCNMVINHNLKNCCHLSKSMMSMKFYFWQSSSLRNATLAVCMLIKWAKETTSRQKQSNKVLCKKLYGFMMLCFLPRSELQRHLCVFSLFTLFCWNKINDFYTNIIYDYFVG